MSLARAALGALLATGLFGCGYSTGLRASDRVASVAVTYFANDTLERDLERSLQSEISRAVETLTDVPLAEPQRAEVLLRGRVTNFRYRGGIRSTDNVLLETGVYVEVEAFLADRRNDRALGPAKRAGTWVGYTTDSPSNAPEARARALRNVADQIVLELFSPVE